MSINTDIVPNELEYIRNRILIYKESLDIKQQIELLELLENNSESKYDDGFYKGEESAREYAQSKLTGYYLKRLCKTYEHDLQCEALFTDKQIEIAVRLFGNAIEGIDIT